MIGAHRLTGHSGDETVVAGRSGDVVSTVRHTTTGRTGASGCSRVATVEVRRVDEVGRPGRDRVPGQLVRHRRAGPARPATGGVPNRWR